MHCMPAGYTPQIPSKRNCWIGVYCGRKCRQCTAVRLPSSLNLLLMMTSSNGNIFALLALCVGNSPVSGEFPSQRPVTRSFDAFVDLRLDKPLSKQSRCRWFETSSRSLCGHCIISQCSGRNKSFFSLAADVTLCNFIPRFNVNVIYHPCWD